MVNIITKKRAFFTKSESILQFNALENDIRVFVNDNSKSYTIQYQILGYDNAPISTVYPKIRCTKLEGVTIRFF
jgi:hypothetical protein